MRKFGLIGYPLGHSFSRSYFTRKFMNESIPDCCYENFPIADISLLPGLISSDQELTGLNVTIPYKSDVFRFLDVIDPEAAEIGAVNVIKILRGSSGILLKGFNSDVTGIRDSLAAHINETVSDAIVLGTGGSSRAVCYVLRKYGLNVIQVSRIGKPGIISYDDLKPEILERATFIINTTPLGMFPAIDHRPEIDYSRLNKKHVLFDLVYNPELTYFLKSGMDKGCTVISGLKMLYSQAERSWEIWNDENL